MDPGLEFSTAEPAVNVYTEGGSFEVHEDKQCFTILIPLNSECDNAFTGGGTTFWRREDRDAARDGRAEPTLALKPPAGTAIVFGGTVTHAARPVTSGTRCVWVASFSPKERVFSNAVQTEAWLKDRGLTAVDRTSWEKEQQALTRAFSRMYTEGAGVESEEGDDEEEYDPDKDPPIEEKE